MSSDNTTITLSLFRLCNHCIRLGIVCKLSLKYFKCRKYFKDWRNCCLVHLSVKHRQILKETTFLQQENCQLQDQLLKINDRIIKIESMKEKIMLFEEVENTDNPETIKFLINNYILVYYLIFSDKSFTPLVYLRKFNKLLFLLSFLSKIF